jgi:hypothetical protein
MANTRKASEEKPFFKLSEVISFIEGDALKGEVFSKANMDLVLGNILMNLDETFGNESVMFDVPTLITLTVSTEEADLTPIVFTSQLKDIWNLSYPGLNKPTPQGELDPKGLFDVTLEKWISANGDAMYIAYEDLEQFLANAYIRGNSLESEHIIGIMERVLSGLESTSLVIGMANDFFIPEVTVEGGSSSVPPEPEATWYNADSMDRRRPDGEFFMVEMIAPTENFGNPSRVDIEGPGGVKISSIKLNMSPNSLIVNASKKINRAQTMTRWLEEHWGDEMDQISFSGSTFAFIRFPKQGDNDGGGLCVDSRDMTAPFMELQNFVNIYKLNGCVYQADNITGDEKPREFFNYANPSQNYQLRNHPRAGFIKHRLYIRLRCDFAEFIGYFDSFDIVEDADSPFRLTYNLSFKSEFTRWL